MYKVVVYFIIGFLGMSLILFTCNMCNDGSETVQNEFKPSALLKKYEYFKDLSAGIDKKRADIELYRSEVESEKDVVERNQLKAELRGIISVHNQLCSEYNSAMSKFNFRFTNNGDLPASNLDPLPREIKPYILSLK